MDRASADLQNTVVFEGCYYATLDFAPPDGTDSHAQEDYLDLPEGWQLAPNEPEIIKNVVGAHKWGTQVMVLRDGTAWNTRYYHCAGMQHGEGFLLSCGNGYKPNHEACSNVGTMFMMPSGEVLTCRALRILIRTPQRFRWNDMEYCSELTAGMWMDKRFTDCDVVCAETVTPCHRVVLARASPVLDRMLSSGMLEAQKQRIVICDTEPEAVQALLVFAYTGKAQCKDHALPELLRLADFYQMEPLALLCAERALEEINGESVPAVVRALRGFRGRPEMEAMWARLMEKVHEDPELFKSVMMHI